jgi:hypothetical protein
MDSHWQEELLELVTQYGEQCGQHATERATGIHGHPPANRGAAWAALMAHLSHEPATMARAPEPADTA